MTGTITMHERKPSGQLTAAETQSVGTGITGGSFK